MIQIDMQMPEKCSDCIFCDDNCSCVASDYNGIGINVGCAYRTERRDIRCPMKEQKPEKGHWEPYKYGDDTWHQCSACGVADRYISIVKRDGYPDERIKSKRNFCPNCGADMRGEQ